MSLEDLVGEIRRRGEAELAQIESTRAGEEGRLSKEREAKLAEIRDHAKRTADLDAVRERTQRLAAAKLKSRKLLYEAREARLETAVAETRELLRRFTATAQYDAVLRRMVDSAAGSLGKPIRVSGRVEDAGRLQKAAGKSFDPTPQPILGGIIAESQDGSRRLHLSFDELLRLREDRVRELLA